MIEKDAAQLQLALKESPALAGRYLYLLRLPHWVTLLTSYVMAATMVMKIASFQLAAMAIGCLDAAERAAEEQQIPKYQRANDEDVSH